VSSAPASTAREDIERLPVGLVDAATGIIGRVACGGADGTPEGLPVCAVAALRRSGACEVGFGKGLTGAEATIGAIGEALEIYGGSSYSDDDLRREAFVRMGDGAMDPRLLCLYENSSYDRPGFPYARFEPERPIHWTKGHWLDTGEPVWLPALTVFHYFPAAPAERFCQVTSNGSATGRGFADAAFRAVLELVERDAFMLTWYARVPATEVIVDEDLDPGLTAILNQIQAKAARPQFYMLNAGIDIPTILCCARGDGKNWPGATLGLGTHPSPRIALKKAILEMGQTAHSLCRAMHSGEEPIPAKPSDVRTFRQHALYYLRADRAKEFDFLDAGKRAIRLSAVDEPGDFPLSTLLQRMSDAGTRVAVKDLTTPDLRTTPFSVVRALGTNLQQIHCGFGMERTNNARLRRLLRGRVNRAIPPFC
jgi:ribosomal protein S12 methylthiotransferase accessory factor